MANSLQDLPAYQLPGVEVIENFTGITPELTLFNLTNINVGPAFYVASQVSAGTYTGALADYAYPGQPAGTYIDARPPNPKDLVSYPVTAYLQNAVVTLITGTVGAVDASSLLLFDDATSAIFAKVVAGDVIVVTGSAHGNNGNYTVRSVISANQLQVNEPFAAVETGLSYTIVRNLTATSGADNIALIPVNMTANGVIVSPTQLQLPAGLTYVDPVFGTVPVVSATVLISYRAQSIVFSSEIQTYTTTQELEAAFGVTQIVPQNPIAFAAYLALTNGAPSTDILALDYQYLTNEELSYQDAFSILEGDDEYVINVLTQNPAVHTALAAHVDLMSEPQNKLERVGVINHALVTTQVVVDATTTGSAEGITGPSGGPFVTLNSASGVTPSTFLTDGVVPGMFVNVTAPSGVVGVYQIAAVVSQTQLTLVSGPATGANAVTFSITENLTLDQQATTIAAYAASIGDRRMVCTWPDIVTIPVGSTITPLPGYFLGCALGALTTAKPTQQGFTNTSVATYSGVVHSTKYFSPTQLNEIAQGGVMIFVQAKLNVSALYIRHQLTTDRSAVKFQEYSITKNVDFIAKFIRQQFGGFPGKYNIVDTMFDDAKTNAKGIINYLTDFTKQPKIGGVLVSGKLLSIIQDPNNIDGVISSWSLDIPIPLNYLTITIYV